MRARAEHDRDGGSIVMPLEQLDERPTCRQSWPEVVDDDQARLESRDRVPIRGRAGVGRDAITFLFQQLADQLEDPLVGVDDQNEWLSRLDSHGRRPLRSATTNVSVVRSLRRSAGWSAGDR